MNADENEAAIKSRHKKSKPLIYHHRFIEHELFIHVDPKSRNDRRVYILYPVYAIQIDNTNAQRSKIYPKNLDFVFSVLINSAVL